MKTEKLGIRSQDGSIDEEILLSFDDKELEVLARYKENLERLKEASILKNMPHITSFRYNVEEGMKYEYLEFNTEDVSALLHLARPFLLDEERASFKKTLDIFGKKGKGTNLNVHLKAITGRYEKGTYQPYFQISVKGIPLFTEKTLKSWLYGIEYHQDREKRELVKELEEVLGEKDSRAFFLSQLLGKMEAIFLLGHLVLQRKVARNR